VRVRLGWALVPALAVIAAFTGASEARQSARAPLSRASLRADLDHYFNTRRVAEHISAVSLAVSFRGHRPGVDLVVGRTRYRGGRPISSDALWQIGSNTKAFTSVIMLQLEAEGRLSINDRLGKWLPQYRAWRRITIKQLLNMTSGIRDCLSQKAFLRAYVADPDRVFSAKRLVSYVVGLPRKRGWHYANTNYVLAQMIIEKVTHDSYADQLRKRIIKPLGLHDLFLSAGHYPPSVISREPAGY
jgi:D-alanyl-D-alanine carboxypeptidase